LAHQDAGAGKQEQVLGNMGLSRTDRSHNLVDRARLAADGLQSPQSIGSPSKRKRRATCASHGSRCIAYADLENEPFQIRRRRALTGQTGFD